MIRLLIILFPISSVYAQVSIYDTLRIYPNKSKIPNAPLDIFNLGGLAGGDTTKNNVNVSLFKLSYSAAFSMNAKRIDKTKNGGAGYVAIDTLRPLVYYEVGTEGLTLHGMPVSPSNTPSDNVDGRGIMSARVNGLRSSGNLGTYGNGKVWVQNYTGMYAENSKGKHQSWSTSSSNTTPFGYFRKEGENITPSWVYTSVGDNNTGQFSVWQKARGTLAIPSNTLFGDIIYSLKAQSFYNGAYSDAAEIKIVSSGNNLPANTIITGKVSYSTHPLLGVADSLVFVDKKYLDSLITDLKRQILN